MTGQRIVRRALEQAWMRVEIEGERGVEEVTCLAVRGCRGGGHSEERQGRGGEEAAPAAHVDTLRQRRREKLTGNVAVSGARGRARGFRTRPRWRSSWGARACS